MKDFINKFEEFSPLDDGARRDLSLAARSHQFKKGDVVFPAGSICRHLYFVDKGLMKIFSVKGGKELIMCFFAESRIFSVFDSLLTKTPTNSTITALEDSSVTMISLTEMEALSKKHKTVEIFFRRIISHNTVLKAKRIDEMLGESSSWRYQNFMEENKHFAHRISLGDIAKFLGITQQSLSRIRSQK